MKKFIVTYIIDEVKSPEDQDAAFVVGRCGDEPLTVGDTFTDLYYYIPPENLEGFGQPSKLAHVQHVQLTIKGMWNYDRYFNVISEGLTAKLLLTGTGSEQLKEGSILAL